MVPGLIAPKMQDVLNTEVNRLMGDVPPPTGHVGHHFYWRTPRESPTLFDPLRGGGILAVARELVGEGGVDLAFDQAQVDVYKRQPYSCAWRGRHGNRATGK